MQSALEAEVTGFLGRDRYGRGERARAGHRNGYSTTPPHRKEAFFRMEFEASDDSGITRGADGALRYVHRPSTVAEMFHDTFGGHRAPRAACAIMLPTEQ